MKKIISIFLLLFFTLMLIQPVTLKNTIDDKIIYYKISNNIYVGILPRVELLAGVLSYTSWMKKRGPKTSGNKYFRDLKKFLIKYKDHEAIKIAEELTKNGFTYDAPLNFILNCNNLPELNNTNGYNNYIIKKAKGLKNLENYRLALKDLSDKSDFITFYNNHKKNYKKYIEKEMKNFNGEKISGWFKIFFNNTNVGNFHIILAPAMFPDGGYGISKTENDKLNVFQVIREKGNSTYEPEFTSSVDHLNFLTLHEFSHSFVNPVTEKNINLIEKYKLEDLYKPVETEMKKMAYGRVVTFFNEMLVNSITNIAYKELYNDLDYYNDLIKKNKNKKFYFIEYTMEKIEYYQQNRTKFKKYDDFIPYLFEQYYKDKKILLEMLK